MTPPSSSNPETVWHYKPWWCQPWSIVLTGTGLMGGSWFLLHRVWITALVAIPVLVWMGFFLLVYPRVAMSMLQEDIQK